MVARGDLGVEIPLEDVPVVQHELVALARSRSKPCIVATQMLESMIVNPQPTRAEVSDVSTAVFAGADAVMLSAETASGAHPVAAVATMDRIARRVEAYLFGTRRFRMDGVEPVPGTASASEALARATAQLSRDLRCRAIVVVGEGEAAARARVIAAARPGAPIVVVSPSRRAVAQTTLVWGVVAVLVPAADLEAADRCARREARRLGLAEPGEEILLVEGQRGEGGADDLGIAVLRV
jgi:pyruvate kinase